MILKRVIALALILLSLLAPVPIVAQDQPGQVKYPTALDSPDSLNQVKDRAQTRLAASLSASATTAEVKDTSLFPSSGFIVIDGREIASFTSKDQTHLYGLSRGKEGTVASNHVINSSVEQRVLAVDHTVLSDALRKTQRKLGFSDSTPSLDKFLVGATTPGSSTWRLLTEADITTALGYNPAGAAELVNVKKFGAKGNVVTVTDGAMNISSSTLTCATSQPFTSAVVGYSINVDQAGDPQVGITGFSARNNKVGTITGYVSPSQVTVSFTAAWSFSGKQVKFGTNDTAAIAAAQASLNGSPKKRRLYFPYGEYFITAGITALSSQVIEGDGPGVSILTQAGVERGNDATDFITVNIPDGTSKVTVRNMTLAGCNATGMQVTGIGGYSLGVKVGTGAGGAISDIFFQNVEFAHIYGMGLRSDGDASAFGGGSPVGPIKIQGCKFHHISDNSININSLGGLLVEACDFSDIGAAIEHGGGALEFSHNTVTRAKATSVAVGGLGDPYVGKGALIHHNLIEKAGSEGVGIGIQVGGNIAHVRIESNIIRENDYQGIGLNDFPPTFSSLSRDIKIAGNKIISNGSFAEGGFGIVCAIAGTVIEDNDIYDDQVPDRYQRVGVIVSADYIKLSRNRRGPNGNLIREYSFSFTSHATLHREETSSVYFVDQSVFTGTVDTSATSVTWKTGQLFEPSWAGVPIRINSVTYQIASVAAHPSGTLNANGLSLTRVTGPSFSSAWVGKYFRVGQIYFVIASVADSDHLTLEASPYNSLGVVTGAAWELYGSTSLTLANSAGTQTGVVYARDGHFVFSEGEFNEVTAQRAAVANEIDLSAISAPATPASGKVRVYSRDDAGTLKVYYKRPDNTEVQIGGGGGSGDVIANATRTLNRLTKWTNNGTKEVGNSLLLDDGSNVQLTAGLLQFHGTTSSFPALKRNGTTLEVKTADDSNFANLKVNQLAFLGASLATAGDGVIEQSGGLQKQEFYLYNFTSGGGSNFEAGSIGWLLDDAFYIQTVFSGTGVARPIIMAPGQSFAWKFDTDNNLYGMLGHLILQARGEFRFYDADSSNYAALRAPAAVSSNVRFDWPVANLVTGKVLSISGVSGSDITLAWVDQTGGGGGGQTVTVNTAAGPFTASASANAHSIFVINQTAGAAYTFNLPSSPGANQLVQIKDGKGDSDTNNITVQGNGNSIDGAASKVINSPYANLTLVWNGTQWNIL